MYLPLTTKLYKTVINDIDQPCRYFNRKLMFDLADRELMSIQDNWYYSRIQRELDETLFVDMIEFIVPITDSYEVNDDRNSGYYTYLAGALDNDVPFIYAKPLDDVKCTPFRLYLYGPKYQLFVAGDHRKIICDEETHHMRNALMIGDEPKILSILKNTDRPVIYQ